MNTIPVLAFACLLIWFAAAVFWAGNRHGPLPFAPLCILGLVSVHGFLFVSSGTGKAESEVFLMILGVIFIALFILITHFSHRESRRQGEADR